MKEEFQKYINSIPAVKDAFELRETFWLNDKMVPEKEQPAGEISTEQICDASKRLLRFAPYLKRVFPELEETGGIIESELRNIMPEWKAV